MRTGIADALISIFNTQLLDSITEANIDAFYKLTLVGDENLQLLHLKKPYPGLIRLFVHPDQGVICNSIDSTFNILLSGLPPHSSTEKHEHFEIMTECDGINKIYELFKRKLNKDITNNSALCLSQLFKAREITDSKIKKDIIKHLKTIVNDEDELVKDISILRLQDLAQNEVNKAEIEKDGFVIPTRNL
ncbi:MAG: hypothetical protein EZS28_033231 [Streblomastix strix]|uniref:Uncharacterized protein n=1 Tax=Streblomastix strix TaxID=222440 RepID=A0A5J4UMJ8_9EUKA|nr:MAG: hypothetical protein EZS28_033231 [Streblomastix strix]